MRKAILFLILIIAVFLIVACGRLSKTEQAKETERLSASAPSSGSGSGEQKETEETTNKKLNLSGRIPEELELIPDKYLDPAEHPGTLEKLTYKTWESFTYEQHSQELTKEAWVYLPYGYSEDQRYNIFYLSHGGWSNETTIMGTADEPLDFKHIVDHAVEDGKIQPMILVMLTYNNTSPEDSSNRVALDLVDQYHNELVYDLIPAVESKYSTFAQDTTPEGVEASRDHRGFGGFSMGSVNTGCTFRYALPYFRYFMPMSGSYTTSGRYMASLVTSQGYTANDFFIYSMSGADDFAYSGIKSQINAMAADKMFTFADTEEEGNLAWRERDGFSHGREASNLYTYNGLMFFWNGAPDEEGSIEQESNTAQESNTLQEINTSQTRSDLPVEKVYSGDSKIAEVIEDPAFEDYGRFLFPVNTSYYSGDRLGNLSLTWYGKMDPDKTAEIVNTLRSRAAAGEKVFYDIYTDEEIAADPSKADTGLFYFKGNPGEKFAVCNAGGGMVFVGAMHDSFPHALELSKKGYNAFALIYRPGYDTAPADLARAIAFIFEHADELEVDTSCYSLWGGSAGARMAAWLGSYGTATFGEPACPQAGAVIMQYTGLTEVTGNEPPTYNCVGTSDGIASYQTMQRRIDAISANGTDTMIEIFNGLPHGFGLGTGTVAEGWLDNAVAFWERQMAK